MVKSRRGVTFAILSLAGVIVSCSNGQLNQIQSLSRASQVEKQNSEQIPANQVNAEKTQIQGAKADEKSPDFDLGSSASDGAISVASIDAARAAGMSDEKIISEAARLSLSFKVDSLSALGLAKYVLKQYGVGSVDGILAMGLAAVDRARAAGVTDNEIRTYAKLQGISFGEKALVSLGLAKYVLSSYGVGDVGGIKAMGLASVDRARAAGLSDDEIRKFATLQVVYFGEKALNSLGLSKFVLKNYGTGVVDGVTAMGLAGVDRARAAGLTDAEIKIYAKLQGIFFGEKALISLG